MKKAFFAFVLLSVLVSPSMVVAQTPPPKPTNADAVIAAFKAAGLEAESPKAMTRKDYGKAPLLCKGTRFLLPSVDKAAVGRAFYCSKEADGDKLTRYYTSLGEQSAELFTHVFAQPPYVVQLSGDLPDEQAAKYEEALAALVGASATKSSPNAGFEVEIQKAGYERWGRPAAMDNPNHPNCQDEDNVRPILKLGISLAVKNTGTVTWPTGTRTMRFYTTGGREAFWCYYNFIEDKPYPETAPGGAYIMSYLVFVERDERVGYGEFEVQDIGKFRFDIPQNIPLP